MKNKIASIVLIFIAALFIQQEPAQAINFLPITGKWAGPAFAASFDLDGDGNAARTFDLRVYGQPLFQALQGVTDAALAALPAFDNCEDPLAIELVPFGHITFRGYGKDALYADIDPQPHLCFNPSNPNEELHFTITGGSGIYAGRSGTGIAKVFDTVRLQNALSGAPQYIDSFGEFTIYMH